MLAEFRIYFLIIKDINKKALKMDETLERGLKYPRSPLEKKIAHFGKWFHNLHLPDGTQTVPNHPLGDFPKFKWEQISPFLPNDLSGWKVLDVGCNAGFYSFELAKRGANVLGIDIDDHYLEQAKWAASEFKLQNKTEFLNMQVYEAAKLKDTFDIIFFMGVFYHLRYPLLALDILTQKFSKKLIFQTLTMPGEEIYTPPENISIEERKLMLKKGWPKFAFIEKALSGDYTNWWAPNQSAVEACLRSAGLCIDYNPAHEIYICSKNKNYNFDETELNSAKKYLNKKDNNHG